MAPMLPGTVHFAELILEENLSLGRLGDGTPAAETAHHRDETEQSGHVSGASAALAQRLEEDERQRQDHELTDETDEKHDTGEQTKLYRRDERAEYAHEEPRRERHRGVDDRPPRGVHHRDESVLV